MLINEMSRDLEFVGYSDIGFARCVDIKGSTSCHILTLACGAISWKSSKMTLMTLVMMQCSMLRGYQAGCMSKCFPEITVVDNIFQTTY
jgi:hypothetical protein